MATAPANANTPQDPRLAPRSSGTAPGGPQPRSAPPPVNGVGATPANTYPTTNLPGGGLGGPPRTLADAHFNVNPGTGTPYAPSASAIYDSGRAIVLDPYHSGRIATELADVLRPTLAGLYSSTNETFLRSERAAVMGERAKNAVADLRVTMTSQTSNIANAVDRVDRLIRGLHRPPTPEDVARVVSQELAKVGFATPDSVSARVVGEFDRRFAVMYQRVVSVEGEVKAIRAGIDDSMRMVHNNLTLLREITSRHAELAEGVELKRKRGKKGPARTGTLIAAAARAAAPYMRPPVILTDDAEDPVAAVLGHVSVDRESAELASQLTRELSPVSPPYEPEEGEVVDPSTVSSGSGSSGSV